MTFDSLTTRSGDQSGAAEEGLLELYLAGKLTGPEVERVERWLDGTPQARQVIGVFREGIVGVGSASADARQMVGRLRVERDNVGMARWGGFKAQPLRWSAWSAVALFVFACVVMVAGWHAQAPHPGARQEAVSVYTTGNGERATITLPDSGTVALNVASRLEVPVDYMTGHHTVRLIGEGLFTVPRHSASSFVVLAGGRATRVLGTTFVVRHYATDTATLVAVREGKVAVAATVVTAGTAVEVGRTGVVHPQPADGAQFTFANGILTLDGLPLSAAIKELDRWYDADIRLGDSTLARYFMKGTVAAGSLADLQTMLEEMFDVRVVRDGRVLTIYPRR